MPAKSKAQQRFMGLVHAYNKGDVKGSEVSKAVKDVAKDMKKKDVKDFASTTHKGKPEKVKQELLNKLKEMIRMELEGCGYTTSAVDPNYKLKSPGGTGEEDEKLKEAMKTAGDVPFGNFNYNPAGKKEITKLARKYGLKVKKITKGPNYEPTAVLQGDEKKLIKFLTSKDYGADKYSAEDMLERKLREGEQEKIYDLLVKYGNTEKDAKQMIAKTYKYIKSAYRNSTPAKKAEIMSSLMKMETKQWVELSEKCWKGYEKKGTKKMFGKTYPNCVKKENVNPLTEMDYRGFVKYMNDFYGPKGVYPDKKKRTLKMKDIGTAYSVLLKKKPNFEIGYDSTDREFLRDILIKMKKLDPDYSQKESVDESKTSDMMRNIRKGGTAGPWSLIVSKNNSIRRTVMVKNLKEIPAYIADLKKKFPNHKIGIESKGGKIVHREALLTFGEAVDMKQGTEILNQLGGKRFMMFTGAKHFGVGKEGLSFKIGRNSKQVNHIKIDYDRGRDLYNMKFDWVTKNGIKNKKTLKGVYADQLQRVFSMHTGMATKF